MTIATFSLGTLGNSIFYLNATDACLVIVFFSKLMPPLVSFVPPGDENEC